MRIALFGATGETGKEVINTALENHIDVNALCRSERNCDRTSAKVNIIEGLLEEYPAVKKTVAGCDAVVVTIGPRAPFVDIFCARATENIIKAMKQHGVKKLIVLTGAMIGESNGNHSFMFSKMKALSEKKYEPMMNDRKQQEDLVKKSGLEWILVKPPRLTLGNSKVHYYAGPDVKVGLMSSVCRKDIADFIIKQLESKEFVKQAVFIRH